MKVKALTETRTEEAKNIRKQQSRQKGKDFSPRRGKELKFRDDDNANTVTATQGVEQLICIQKTGGYCTTFKNNETGTLQSGGANVMDKVPNVVIQINPSKESGGKQPYQHNRVYSTEGLIPNLDSDQRKNILIDSPTLHGFEHGTNGQLDRQLIKGGMIRRLTEVECERLQGYPDNWTEYGIYKKQVWINKKEKTFEIVEQKHKIPRTQRYKLCGNAVTKDIVELIGRKLLEK